LGDNVQTTYYVRDLQGNVLAVYEHKHAEGESGTFTLAEQHLYGASRIGITKPNLALNTTMPDAPVPTIHYELTNHLGNVMAVITDEPATTETPAVESLADYYPFGMTMPGRSYNAHTYRHGFTGHEKENDLAEGIYTTEYRLYDARVGRWLSIDPLFEKYVGMSPYNYCMLNPAMMVDPDGREIKVGKIVYIPGKTKISMGKTDFERNTIMALNYLYNGKSDKVKGVIEKLCNTDRYNITIQKSNDSRVTRSYIEKEQLLEWDDHGAMETDNGVKLSPANGLFHEMGHLDLHLDIALAEDANDPEAIERAYSRELPDVDPTFGPAYDYYPVREYETEAAISNGEFIPSETVKYTRTNYNGGRLVQVESPISNDF
jgi:RHS repeat-associated protein